MKISSALQNVSGLFLDTAPVIYLIEKNPAYFDRVEAIFGRIDNGQVNAVTSPVTLAECLVQPIRQGLTQLQQDFIDVVVNGSNTSFVLLDQQTGEIAAQLRAQYKLRLPDALQLAAALNHGCDAFLTNDAQLKRVTELQILVIDDLQIG
ncbi:MAG: type II toxin-antitoxin system VapC family toxin [Blastocatellia bacterium]